MLCPGCGRDNRGEARFCDGCGATLERRCPSCERELRSGARFCDGCGASIDAPVRPDRAQTPSPSTLPTLPTAPPEAGRAQVPERDPRDYTPKHLADAILQSKSALEGERKQVTVLFADVKGSMELAEQLDPERWHEILDRFFQILADGVHRFDGTINQYTGDGIMALFGAPIAHEDHAERACYAALELRDTLRTYADELRMDLGLTFSTRVGINSGEVVVGKIGDDLRMDYTAQGMSVGLAQRMESLADGGNALLTEHTARLVEGYFELRDLGETRVKGLQRPVRVSELVGLGAQRTRLDRARARGFSSFVGRDSERKALESALEKALLGQGQVIGVVAEAGIGKSRLCARFLEDCRARGIEVQQTTGLAHGRNLPLAPILQLLRDTFGIDERDGEQAQRDKIAGRIVLGDESLTAALPLVLDFMGVPDPKRPVPPMEPEARQHQILDVVRRMTQVRSARSPAVWLIEDLHWLDPASDAFVANLVDAVPGTRTVLLLNFRPEYRAAFAGRSTYQQIPLHPLGPAELGQLLGELLGDDPSLEGLSDLICERTGGNPFFVEEVIRTLEEEGVLSGKRGAYQLARTVEELSIPTSVQTVLAARIDRLAGPAKQALQTAAVAGAAFSRGLLAAATDLSETDLDCALRDLVNSELIFQEFLYPEPEYAFRHALTREIAYRTVLGEGRARRHAAVALALEKDDPARVDERAALIAHHWENAQEPLQAARWHRRAATWSGRAQLGEALRQWARVRELLLGIDAPTEVLELRLEALNALITLSSPGQGLDTLESLIDESHEIARQSQEPRIAARAHFSLGAYFLFRQESARAHVELGEAYRIACDHDPDFVGSVLSLYVIAVYDSGRPQQAADTILEFEQRFASRLDVGRAEIGVSPLVVGLSYRALWLGTVGRFHEGAVELERALEMGHAQGDPAALSMIQFNATCRAVEAGNIDDALASARRATEHGQDATTVLAQAIALAGAGRWAEAEAAFSERERSALSALLRVWAHLRGLALHGIGQTDRALALLRDAAQHARNGGSVIVETRVRLTLACILIQSAGTSARGEIETNLARVESLISQTGAILYSAGLQEARAEWLTAQGETVRARHELAEAQRRYAEMGADGHAARVGRVLTR